MLSIMLSITIILFRSTVATNNCSQKITQQLQQWIHSAQLALSAFPPSDVTSLSSDYDEPQSLIPAEPIESDQVPRGSRCPTTIQDARNMAWNAWQSLDRALAISHQEEKRAMAHTLQGIRVIPPKRGNLYSTEVSGGQTGSGILFTGHRDIVNRKSVSRHDERFGDDGTGVLSVVDSGERANLSAGVVMIEQQDDVMQNEGATRRETGDMDVLEVSMGGAGAMRDGLCSTERSGLKRVRVTREVGDVLLRQMSDEGEIGGSFDDDARDVLVNGSVDLGEGRSGAIKEQGVDVVVGDVLLDAYHRDRGESELEKGVITNEGGNGGKHDEMDYIKNFVGYGLGMIGIIGIIVICCIVKRSSDEQKNGVNGNGKDIEQEREDIV